MSKEIMDAVEARRAEISEEIGQLENAAQALKAELDDLDVVGRVLLRLLEQAKPAEKPFAKPTAEKAAASLTKVTHGLLQALADLDAEGDRADVVSIQGLTLVGVTSFTDGMASLCEMRLASYDKRMDCWNITPYGKQVANASRGKLPA